MPVVPQYQQTERPQGYQQIQPITGGTEAINRAVQGLANQLQQTSNETFAVALKEKERMDKAVAQEAMTFYETERTKYWDDVAKNRQGKNALGTKDTPSVSADANQWHSDIVKNLLADKNKAQQRLLTDYFISRGENLNNLATTYEREQGSKYEAETASAYQKTMIDKAIQDPSQTAKYMDNYAVSALDYGKNHGIAIEKSNQQIQEAWGIAVEQNVNAMLDKEQTQGATKYLEKHKGNLSAVQYQSIQGNIHKVAKQIEKERVALHNLHISDNRKRLEDAIYRASQSGDTSQVQSVMERAHTLGDDDTVRQCKSILKVMTPDSIAGKAPTAPIQELREAISAETKHLSNPAVVNNMSVDEHKLRVKQVQTATNIYNERVKLLETDPAQAGLAIVPDKKDNSVEENTGRRLVVQEQEGVPKYKTKPLTLQESNALSEQYTHTQDPTQFIKSVSQTYGKYAPDVFQQLVSEKKVPRAVNFILDMNPQAGNLLSQTFKTSLSDTEKALNLQQVDVKDIKELISENINDALQTFARQGDMEGGATLADSVYRLTLQYLGSGSSRDEAIQKASDDVFLDRYSFEDTYRVPKQYDIDNVNDGLDSVKQSLCDGIMAGQDVDILIPQNNTGLEKEQYASRVADMIENSMWVTNFDDSGVMLVSATGRPIYTKDGNLFEVRFDDATKKGLDSPSWWTRTKNIFSK